MLETVTPIGVLVALSVWLSKELYDLFKKKEEKSESKTEKLIDAIQENTLAVTKLTIRMDLMEKRLEAVPEIEKDLAKLGQKIRDISPRNLKGKN